MRIEKFLLLIFFLGGIFSEAESADHHLKIKLMDGSILYAIGIDSSRGTNFSLLLYDSTKANVSRDYILNISKISSDSVPKRKIFDKNDEAFWELGVIFGAPTFYGNFSLGRSSRPFVTHISGMYYGSNRGIQLDIGYMFYGNINYYQTVSILLGNTTNVLIKAFENGLSKWNKASDYIGIAYTVKYRKLYLQLGGFYMSGKANGFFPTFQAGLMI